MPPLTDTPQLSSSQADTEPNHTTTSKVIEGEDIASQLVVLTIGDASAPRTLGLIQLPNELVKSIIAYVTHDDLVKLALGCKFLHSLAREALQEHQTLLREWGYPAHNLAIRGTTRLYRRIMDDPRRALYVRKLSIWEDTASKDPETSEDDADIESIVVDSKSGQFSDFIDEVLDESCRGFARRNLGWGEEIPIAAFLCCFLPNLNSLDIRYDRRPSNRLRDLTLALQCRLPTKIAGRQFSNLKCVQIQGGYCPEEAFDLLLLCARLPSIESLDGHLLVAGLESDFTMENRSNVKELTIHQCTINEKAMLAILAGMRLRRFSCWQLRPARTISAILDALVISSRESLESLLILGHGGRNWTDEKGQLALFGRLDPADVKIL